MKPPITRHPVVLGLAAGGVLVSSASVAGVVVATIFARRFVTPEREQPDDATVLAVQRDETGVSVRAVFAPTVESTAPGRYGLFWQNEAGHARIGEIVEILDTGDVVRTVDGVTRGELRPGRARWSGYYVDGSPEDAFGIPTEVVDLETENGVAPAWVTRTGDGRRWAVLVHGRGARRGETLRAVPVLHALGISTVVPTYRNDPDGPASSDGRYALGLTEWRDVDVAMQYAVRQGATRLDLLGWSMGGAIVMQALALSPVASLVHKVVLDGPVLSWADVMIHHARLNRLHPRVASLAGQVLGGRASRLMVGVAEAVDVRLTDWVARADELRTPMLIIHSVDDEFVPHGPSRQLAQARPDLVRWERWDVARHVREWNTDPQRWERVVAEYLRD